jgi:hypothetical protein
VIGEPVRVRHIGRDQKRTTTQIARSSKLIHIAY